MQWGWIQIWKKHICLVRLVLQVCVGFVGYLVHFNFETDTTLRYFLFRALIDLNLFLLISVEDLHLAEPFLYLPVFEQTRMMFGNAFLIFFLLHLIDEQLERLTRGARIGSQFIRVVLKQLIICTSLWTICELHIRRIWQFLIFCINNITIIKPKRIITCYFNFN